MALVHRNKAGEQAPSYFPLGVVNTEAATAIGDQYNNIVTNLKGGYKRFHDLPGFQKVKPHEQHIVIACGGPSIKRKEVFNKFKEYSEKYPVICAGSPHDWLIQNGIYPEYTAVCDADPITALYLKEKNPNPNAKYLFASCCDPSLYEKVPSEQIYMWHCHSEEVAKRIYEGKLEKHYQAIGGGCTIGLRAMSLAIMLGYTQHDIFGMDSCLSENEHHAYEFQAPDKEDLGKLYKIKLGINPQYGGNGPEDIEYLCAGYQVAQASQFKDFYVAHRAIFNPVFHGGGMLAHKMRLIKEQEQREMTERVEQ